MSTIKFQLSSHINKGMVDEEVDSINCLYHNLIIHGLDFPNKQIFCYCLTRIIKKYAMFDDNGSKKVDTLEINSNLEISIPEAKLIVQLMQQETILSETRVIIESVLISKEAIQTLQKLQPEYSLMSRVPIIKYTSCILEMGLSNDFKVKYSQDSTRDFVLNVETRNNVVVDLGVAQIILQSIKELEAKTPLTIRSLTFYKTDLSLEALQCFLTNDKPNHFLYCRLFYDNVKDYNDQNSNENQSAMSLLAGMYYYYPHETSSILSYGSIMCNILDLDLVKIFHKLFEQMRFGILTFRDCFIQMEILQDLMGPFIQREQWIKIRFQNCTFSAIATTVQTTTTMTTTILPTIEYLDWNSSDPKSLTLAKNISPKNNISPKSSISTVMKLISADCFPKPITELDVYAIAMNKFQCQEISNHLTNNTVELQKVALKLVNTESIIAKFRDSFCEWNGPGGLDVFVREFDTVTDSNALSNLLDSPVQQNENTIVSMEHFHVSQWENFGDWYQEMVDSCIDFCEGLVEIRYRELLEMKLSVSLFPLILAKVSRYYTVNAIYWVLQQLPQIILKQNSQV